MRRNGIGYQILDKDLRRISFAESAQIFAFRPLLYIGVAILAGVAILLVTLGITMHDPTYLSYGAGFFVASWLGLAIGANDVANSLAPAVGAGAIGLLPGLLLVAVAEVAGASLAGGAVTHRLAEGIFSADESRSAVQLQFLMLAALIGAAIWITLATGAGLPVSTSHSIIGAIAGAAAMALGPSAIHWSALLIIASTWIIAPLATGAIAAAILTFITVKVRDAPDRYRSAQLWIPLLVGLMFSCFLIYFSLLLVRQFALPVLPLICISLLIAIIMGLRLRRGISTAMTAQDTRPRMKRLFRTPLVISVAILAFAHGANDVGNVAGPLSVIMLHPIPMTAAHDVPLALLLGAGLTIGLGSAIFGRRLVVMVGTGITRLSPVRTFCVSLATALVVLAASAAGLPVSTTHIAIGGIFGVGFAREWLDRRSGDTRAHLPAEETHRRLLIRRSHVATISGAWLVTVPLAGFLGAMCYMLISLVAM